MYGATIGRIGILGVPACVNQAVCALARPRMFDVKFIFYVFQASRDYLINLASGGGQPNLNAEKIINFQVPCPSIAEQREIVNNIDYQVEKLD
jgi:restriction endonuclease S subunit